MRQRQIICRPPTFYPLWVLHYATKHNDMLGNDQEHLDINKEIDLCGQNIMSLIIFLMSSYLTVHNDIFLADIMRLKGFVSRITLKGCQQTLLNMFNSIDS